MPRTLAEMVAVQLKQAAKNCSENYGLLQDAARPSVVYMLITGLAWPVHGEYVFLLMMPSDFPKSPPSVQALTPNGQFDPSAKRICISIGEFHAQAGGHRGAGSATGWRPAMGLVGFGRELMNALISGLKSGIGVINSSAQVKAALAAESFAFNRDSRSLAPLIAQFSALPDEIRPGIGWAKFKAGWQAWLELNGAAAPGSSALLGGPLPEALCAALLRTDAANVAPGLKMARALADGFDWPQFLQAHAEFRGEPVKPAPKPAGLDLPARYLTELLAASPAAAGLRAQIFN